MNKSVQSQPFGKVYAERSRSAQGERGAILPILVVILLVIGILVTTGLVKVPQVFKPKASGVSPIELIGDVAIGPDGRLHTSSPTITARLHPPYNFVKRYAWSTFDPQPKEKPIFEDYFYVNENGTNKVLPEGPVNSVNNTNIHANRTYTNGSYEISIAKDTNEIFRSTGYQLATYKTNITEDEYTAVFDAKLTGEGDGPKNIGVVFGLSEFECDFVGTTSCYHYHLENDGTSYLVKQTYHPGYTGVNNHFFAAYNDSKVVYTQKINDLKPLGLQLTFRFDRSKDKIKGWVKIAGAEVWTQVIDAQIDQEYNGRAFGFLVGRPGKDGHTAKGVFDNLVVYKLGDLPEPENTISYRYSFDKQELENDQKGEFIKWEPVVYNNSLMINSIKIPSGSGVKILYVQFKKANEIGEIYQQVITYDEKVDVEPSASP